MELKFKAGQVIFLDTSPIIYYFEEKEPYVSVMDNIFDQAFEKGIRLVASFVTYVEVLAVPEREGNRLLAAKYRDFLINSENMGLYPMDMAVADKTVFYRIKYKMKTPDAIQFAVAELCGADYIVTNDADWKKVKLAKVLVLDEIAQGKKQT